MPTSTWSSRGERLGRGCSGAGALRGLQNRLRGAAEASRVSSILIHPRQIWPDRALLTANVTATGCPRLSKPSAASRPYICRQARHAAEAANNCPASPSVVSNGRVNLCVAHSIRSRILSKPVGRSLVVPKRVLNTTIRQQGGARSTRVGHRYRSRTRAPSQSQRRPHPCPACRQGSIEDIHPSGRARHGSALRRSSQVDRPAHR